MAGKGPGTVVTRFVGDGGHLLRTTRQVRGSLMGVTKEIERTNSRLAKMSTALNTAFRVSAITGSIYALSRALSVIVQNAGQFEFALAGIAKTTNLSNPAVEKLGKTLLAAAIDMGQARIEMLEVAKVAGQLGIHGQRDLAKFTVAITKLAGASNLVAEEGATHLARFLYLTNNTPAAAERVASSIVHLGNNVAATESEILRMATAIAQTTSSLELSDTFISGWAATVAAAGLRVESTSNAIFRFMEGVQTSAREGGKAISGMAEALDLSVEKTRELINQDLEGFVQRLIQSLAHVDPASITSLLYAIGIDDIRTHRSINTTVQQERATGAFSRNIALAESQTLQGEALNREFQRKRETLLHDVESINQRMGAAFERISSVIVSKLLPAYDRLALAVETLADVFGPLLATIGFLTNVVTLGIGGGAVGAFRAYRLASRGTAAARKDLRLRRADDPNYAGRFEEIEDPSRGYIQRQAALNQYERTTRAGMNERFAKAVRENDQRALSAFNSDVTTIQEYVKHAQKGINAQVAGTAALVRRSAAIGGGVGLAAGGAYDATNHFGALSIAERRASKFGADALTRHTPFSDDEHLGKFLLAISDEAEVRKDFVNELDDLVTRLENVNNKWSIGEFDRLLDIPGQAGILREEFGDEGLANFALAGRRASGPRTAFTDMYEWGRRVLGVEKPNEDTAAAIAKALRESNEVGGTTNPLFSVQGYLGGTYAKAKAEKELTNLIVDGAVNAFAKGIEDARDNLEGDLQRRRIQSLVATENDQHAGLLQVERDRRALLGNRDISDKERDHRATLLSLTERQVNAQGELNKARLEVERMSGNHPDGSPEAASLRAAIEKVEMYEEAVLYIEQERTVLTENYDIQKKINKTIQDGVEAGRRRMDMLANIDEEGFFDTFQSLPTFTDEATAAMDRFAGTYTAYMKNMAESTELVNKQLEEVEENMRRMDETTQHMEDVFQDMMDELRGKIRDLARAMGKVFVDPLREAMSGGSFRDAMKAAIDRLQAHMMEVTIFGPLEQQMENIFGSLAGDILGVDGDVQEQLGIKAKVVNIEAESLGGGALESLHSGFNFPGGTPGSNAFGPGLSFPSGLGMPGGGGGGAGGGLLNFVGSLFGGGGAGAGGGGLLSTIGSFASSFLGFFADGGITPRGGFAVVGERGPEIVQLPGGAAVHPNGSMPGGMGQSINVTNVINVEGVQDPGTVRAEVEAQIPMITAATRSALTQEARNGNTSFGRAVRG